MSEESWADQHDERYEDSEEYEELENTKRKNKTYDFNHY